MEYIRKIAIVTLLYLLLPLHNHAQTIIENPKIPENKNAGRVIQLKEVLRISDEGEEFYLKYPWGLDAGIDGSIFVNDGIRLYKFNALGKLERNLTRKGQGPGEISSEISDFIVDENEISVLCAPMRKIVQMDLEGNLIDEIILDNYKVSKLVACYNDKIHFVDFKIENPERKDGIKNYKRNLYVIKKKKVNSIPLSFPTKFLLYFKERFGRAISVTRLQLSTVHQKFVYLSHTQDYLIKKLDLEQNKLCNSFRRDYPRAKYKSNESIPFRYHNDVHRLLVYKSNVWVLTSTFDDKKGILVDVFNDNGIYLDNFYLPLLNSKTDGDFSQLYFPLIIKNDFLYALEHDEEWNFSVVKYEIIDS